MRLSMRQVRYVSEVARLGSILATAQSLHISQSSIIAALNLAEEELDTPLFERRPSRGVVTTAAGDRFVSAARALLVSEAEFEQAIAALSGKNTSEIKIGCFEPFGSLFMPDLIRAYINRAGPVDVALFEGDQTQLYRWLVSKTVDFVVAYDIGPSFNANITPICRVPAHVMIPSNDQLATRETLSLRDVADRSLVLLDLPHTVTYLLALFDTLAVRPKIGFRTRSYPTMSRAVAAGFGVSVLNMRPLLSTVSDIDGVARRPLVDDLPQPTLVVADAYGAQKPEYARCFIDVVHEFFAAHGLTAAGAMRPV